VRDLRPWKGIVAGVGGPIIASLLPQELASLLRTRRATPCKRLRVILQSRIHQFP
jgi:hypothetical protein